MNYSLSVFLLLLLILTGISCQTTDSGTTPDNTKTDATDAADTNQDPNQNDSDIQGEMQSYLDNAQKRMDEMAVSEAINQYVAVLAIAKNNDKKTSAVAALVQKAQTELTKIEAGLLLQPGPEWLDDNFDQVTASSLSAGKENAQKPKVLVFYNVGGSRIALSAVPVFFEFAKGSGLLTGFMPTNEYGEAAVPVGRIDNPNRESVIRATIVYTVKGFTYRFAQTSLEFVYLPPSRRATILVYERGPDYVADDPVIFNPMYNTLKKMDFEFVPFNGKLLGDNFMNVFGGDLSSIKKLTLDYNIPYLVVILDDCFRVNRLAEGMNIFVGEGRATLRIIRVADGKIMFEAIGAALKSDNTHGQGGSEEKTMRDVFARTTKALEKELTHKSAEINKALGID